HIYSSPTRRSSDLPNRKVKVAFGYPYPFIQMRWLENFPCGHKMFDFIEDPGITNRSPSDHYSIHSISVSEFPGFFRGINIPVSKNRNMYSWVVFDSCQITPVRFPFVHLFSGTGVDTDSLNAYVLKSFHYFFDADSLFIPAKACFYSYRNTYRFHDFPGH